MNNLFEHDEELAEIAEEVYNKNPNATLWDVIVELLCRKSNVERACVYILSDFPIVEMATKGYSVQYISDVQETSPIVIQSICTLWGIHLFDETLDFDPVETYTEGMTVDDLRRKLQPILNSMMPDDDVLAKSLANVEKYIQIRDYLDYKEEQHDG